MLRRILVPVDFSAASACALAVARDYCPETALLRLLHVVGAGRLASESATIHLNPMHTEEIRREAEDAATDKLNAWAEELEEIAVEVGSAAERISAHADEWGADMIVMGTSSRSGLSHFLHGSATEWLVRHARQPVLAVHEVDLTADQRARMPTPL